MTKIEIMKKLNGIFREVFDDDTLKISEKTTAKDVDGWDSLMHITLIDAVEEEFDISFDMKTVVKLKNVGEMVDVIMEG